MKADATVDMRQQLGADRVLAPANALPQGAERLDPRGPVRPYEVELAIERICIDSTAHRNLLERAGGDPNALAARVLEIVAARGKMHNPETNSGGILVGTVTAVGERFCDPPEIGMQLVPMASLTQIALRLEAAAVVDPESRQLDVTGTGYFREPWTALPSDMPKATALELLDVCPAASQTKPLIPRDGTVCVLGAGHAGKLVLATAREEMKTGQVVAIDVDSVAIEGALKLGLCDIGVTADLRDPLATLEAARSAGVLPADLTVVVVNASRCEPAAILLTGHGGTTLFLSMATSFGAAALAADGIASEVRLLIGSTHTQDRGAYALDLYRSSAALQEAFDAPV
jgi:L-erythro-3,5-diaminohexanoate dehydrogenase